MTRTRRIQGMQTQNVQKSEAAALSAAAAFAPVEDGFPVVLNSLPKSGTVLLRNILLGFYGTNTSRALTLDWKHYKGYKTFDDLCEPRHRFLVGHFPYHPVS